MAVISREYELEKGIGYCPNGNFVTDKLITEKQIIFIEKLLEKMQLTFYKFDKKGSMEFLMGQIQVYLKNRPLETVDTGTASSIIEVIKHCQFMNFTKEMKKYIWELK